MARRKYSTVASGIISDMDLYNQSKMSISSICSENPSHHLYHLFSFSTKIGTHPDLGDAFMFLLLLARCFTQFQTNLERFKHANLEIVPL